MNNEKLVWTEDISVNNEKLDIQNRKLFDIINELGKEQAATDPEEYARLLSCITDCFRAHFGTEELYLQKIGYPDLKLHHAEHTRLMYDITMFNLNCIHQIPTNTNELNEYMKDKFLNHLLNLDLSYRDFKIMKENNTTKISNSDTAAPLLNAKYEK
jgi:hemerythrin